MKATTTFLLCGAILAAAPPGAEAATNWAEALQKSIFFYDCQRSGALPADNRVTWRGDSALDDGAAEGHDLTGGFYDAGDHVKFGFPMAASTTVLAWGVVDYRAGFEKSGQLAPMLANLRWATDYLVNAHTAENELWGQVGNGSADHSFWGPAEVMPMARPAYKIDASKPGSDLAAETAAALAASSMAFRPTDPAYADLLLSHAKQLYTFADTYRGSYHDSITDASAFYRSWSGYQDELVWGAAWLSMASQDATAKASYLAKAESEYTKLGVNPKWTLNWDDKQYGCHVLLAKLTGKSVYRQAAERHLDYWTTGSSEGRVHYTPGGLAWLDTWGSLRYTANSVFLALVYSDWLTSKGLDPQRAATYASFADAQMAYITGKNPKNRSYVVGFGVNPPKNPHHRTAHGSWADSIQTPTESRHVLYGALVGGPDQNDNYVDDRGDYVANEVALDYNAGFTGALARMVMKYGGTPLAGFPPAEVPVDELFVEARINSQGPRYVEVSGVLHNHTAWPARASSGLSFRYFVDLTDELAKGYGPEDIAVTTAYNQGSGVSPLQVWDAAEDVYFVEVSFDGVEIAPAGQSASKKEVQFRLALPYTSNDPHWGSAGDWSFEGLTSLGHVAAPRIPVYEDGVLVSGQEPGGGTVTPPPPPPPVGVPAAITSQPGMQATVGEPWSYAVVASGDPAPTLSIAGKPAWMSWNGSTLSGVPTQAGTVGPVTVTASNGSGPDATQSFTLTVADEPAPEPTVEAPDITSTPVTTARVGRLYKYTVATTGSPEPQLTVSGAPAWLTLSGNTLSGVPDCKGSMPTLTITASNGVGDPARQSFRISVKATKRTDPVCGGGKPQKGDSAGVPATEGAPGDAEPVGLSPASDAGCSSSGQGAAAPWAAALLALLVVARRGTRRRA